MTRRSGRDTICAMDAAAAFNPLAAARRFREVGFDEAQAEAIASEMREAVMEGVATREDIAGLKTDVSGLKTEIAGLDARVEAATADISALKADVAELKADSAELKADVSTLKADVAELKADNAEIKMEIAGFKGEMAQLGARVEAKIERAVNRLMLAIFGATTVIVAVVELL